MRSKIRSMLVFTLILLLSLSGFSGIGLAESADSSATAHLDIDQSSEKSVTVIVELEEVSVLEAKQQGQNQSKQQLESERERVIAAVEQAAASSEVNQEYDHVFSGFSLEVQQNELPAVLDVEGIKAVYPNETYEAENQAELLDPESFSPAMMDSAPFIGADEAWESGYTGEGITVAVLDTGVDYTHPDLAHAFRDYKGWDFVDNDNDPQETPVGDPRGGSTNHGTHVAGTIAANGQIKGVAPDASLLAYRVLGPGGSGTTQNVIAGIERAVEDGADIMNLSLGNTTNNPDFATSIALDNAMADGVVAVSSNGNSGPDNWTVGSPGTSREAISVGATQLPYDLYNADIFTSEGVSYPSAKVMGFPDAEDLLALNEGEFEFAHAGLGAPADFEGTDFEGKIALISRGEFAFADKAVNAAAAGAVGVVMYNNVAGEIPEIPGMALPTIRTTQADGAVLLSELEAGNNTISFNIEFDRAVGETMASFSSRGPAMDTWMIKPDVSAPGVSIVSTIPTHNAAAPHGYASNSGTSMSAPHVAGAAALILEANPDWSVDFVKAALMNTAENLYDADGNLYPHNSQGTGSIRVLDAINAEVLVTPGSHSFGIFEKDNGREVERQSFTVNNLSNERKRYSIEFTGHQGIKVQTSNNLQVQPGKTQKLNFGVQVDTSNLEPGYYEGTFLLSDGAQTIEVPTILFVQQPDYPLLNSLSLGLAGGNLVGTVQVPGGADTFNLRIRDAATGELLTETAFAENLSPGMHSFSWDMTIDGAPLTPRGYQINAYATSGDTEFELPGGVLTITPE
ncbi:S8 family serine peptidase [Alkalicoccus daliensis]|uniref:Minor extracellular serine protease Vpr n=1 Tax=Alkalicoccus daliensis TaxID=745820 RepID=A0A1H0ETM2_9BACI|nr:S8 family serine peptidase [Alkalicoccus daliensis]SDN85722.1 minor extracellular serine protease Vpr [Alkalicoccus daliensis]